MTKPLIIGILFSAAANAALVTKPLAVGILPSASLILFSKYDLSVSFVVFKSNSTVLMLFTFSTNLSYTVFLATSFFITSFSLLKGAASGLRPFLETESPLKMMENAFSSFSFGQLLEYNMRNTFPEISYTKCGGETSLQLFSEKLKLSISLDQ